MRQWTGRSILERREFAVNVPGADCGETVWRAGELPDPRPVAADFTPIPALKVRPSRVEECRAQLGCGLDQRLTCDQTPALFGRISSVSVDAAALGAEDPCTYLRRFAFLEDGTYDAIGRAWQSADS